MQRFGTPELKVGPRSIPGIAAGGASRLPCDGFGAAPG